MMIWIFLLGFFYFATLTIQTGCFQHNIRSLMTHLQVCQKIFPLLSKDFFLFWVSCCAARTKKILIVFWKPALVAENINVSLRKQRETETFKENKTNIHILINLMLDFQSFNSGPDLTPLNKSIWKTLSGGILFKAAISESNLRQTQSPCSNQFVETLNIFSKL